MLNIIDGNFMHTTYSCYCYTVSEIYLTVMLLMMMIVSFDEENFEKNCRILKGSCTSDSVCLLTGASCILNCILVYVLITDKRALKSQISCKYCHNDLLNNLKKKKYYHNIPALIPLRTCKF